MWQVQVTCWRSTVWWVPGTFNAGQCGIIIHLLLCWWQPLQVQHSNVNDEHCELCKGVVCPLMLVSSYQSIGGFLLNGPVVSGFPRLSLVSRMIPSPDWFVGLDSLDLCRNRGFISSLQVPRILTDGWNAGWRWRWKSSQWRELLYSTLIQFTIASASSSFRLNCISL